MGYFDGNTVTALWRYAQHFAMSDNAYTDTYGPSTPGALEVVAGQTNGMKIVATTKKPSTVDAVSYYVADGQGGVSMINDVDPGYDACSVPGDQAMMAGQEYRRPAERVRRHLGRVHGRLQSANHQCQRHHGLQAQHAVRRGRPDVVDYIPHHNWFQYYASTANPTHARPSAVSAIGYSMQADGKTADPRTTNMGCRISMPL